MPELPEVERARRRASQILTGHRLRQVIAANDPIVFDGARPARITKALTGLTTLGVHRHGKQLWIEFDRGPALLIHLGMTGAIRRPGETPLKLASSQRSGDPEGEWPPRFTKLRLITDQGGELAFTNARRLGRVRLRDDPLNEPPINRLGFDPLNDMPPLPEFSRRLTKRKAPIKAVLLDQAFAAGVGNWIADEVLYQAGIGPRRRANELDGDEIRRIRLKLRSIVRKAVEVDAEKARFPKSWLFHHRWGKNAEAVTSRGEQIIHETVGGRTTAWAPSIQR